MEEDIRKIIEKSLRALESSEREIESGNYDFGCSRAFFAALYMVKGILIVDQNDKKNLAELFGLFKKNYIDTQIFSEEIYRNLSNLVARREAAEFAFTQRITKRMADSCLLQAQNINKNLTRYLLKKLYENIEPVPDDFELEEF